MRILTPWWSCTEVTTMLFSEVYGSYYNVIAAVLSEAVSETLTRERLYEIVQEKAFGESVLTIPTALRDGTWPLLTEDLKTPLHHAPTMPLTTLQKRWMKALLQDPRIRLFGVDDTGLEDVEPLFPADAVVYYDRYFDGDLYDDPRYVECFRTVLTALREKRLVRVRFTSRLGERRSWVCRPLRLEYSAKDDKFRLIAAGSRRPTSLNIARMRSVTLLEPYDPKEQTDVLPRTDTLVLEVTDERNALERVMLHFSHFEKQAEQIDERHYRLTLRYDRDDETELLIRVLSFGPMVKVVAPGRFSAELRERIEKQKNLKRIRESG